MKRSFYVVALLPMLSFAQEVYDVNGKVLCKEHCTIKNVNKSLGINYSHVVDIEKNGNYESVGFKMLTKTPIWVITQQPKSIPQLIKSFNYSKYLSSSEVEMDLDRMIKDKALTDLYLSQSFGPPDNRVKSSDGNHTIELWQYSKIRLTIYFIDGIAYRYDRIN